MTLKMKTTALAMLTLTGALIATTALADRGQGMGAGMAPGMEGEMGMEAEMGPRMGPLADFDFAAIDADKDGKITEAELTAWRAAQAKALDADGDGLVSADELAARQMQGMATRIKDHAARMVERLDTDADGKLSAAELAARPVPARLFDRLDTDGDGAVSQAEVDAAKARMAEGPRMGKHRRGGHFWGRHGDHGDAPANN